MKRIFYSISALLIPIALNSQTYNREAMKHYNNAMYKFFLKDYMGAVTDFSDAIRHDSLFIQSYENMGVAKYYLQDYTGAISDFTKALQLNPEDYNTFGRRGWAKFKLQDCKGAIFDFTKAMEGSQDKAQYYVVRGQAKYYLKDYAGAISDFNWVVNSLSGDRSQRSQALFWRGLVKIDKGVKEDGCSDLLKSGKLGNTKGLEIFEIYCK